MMDFVAARQRMVDSQLRARRISDRRVLDAMLQVPRHEFVPEAYRGEAYEDHPLPIGEGQTISQPYVVAVMLELLRLTPGDCVLEVGTGTGYVTAVLSLLTARVFSIERHAILATTADATLTHLGYGKPQVLTGDGILGLPEYAPFDAILVSAAAANVPPALITQLRDGGRMVIPVGNADFQELQFIRMVDSVPQITRREPVRFVPLISD
jgi:protein-L-isoaspartate(D-aspartate) O-methyltransferase